MSQLPPPIQAIKHLRNKLAKSGTEYDKECMDSIIAFYNTVEETIRIEYKDYYHLFSLLIRYEIVNNRLHSNESISIIDILDKIEGALIFPDYDMEEVNLLLECHTQREINFQNKKKEFDPDSHLTSEQFEKVKEMIRQKIDFLILKKSTINNYKK